MSKSQNQSDTAAVQKLDQPIVHAFRRLGGQCKALKFLLLMQKHKANIHGMSSQKACVIL